MKLTFAALLFTLSSAAFACGDLAGDYLCEDQAEVTYSRYMNLSISNVDLPYGGEGMSVKVNNRVEYKNLILDGKNRPSGGIQKRASCSNNTLKVTHSFGWQSDTDTFQKTSKGLKVRIGLARYKCSSL